LPHIFRGYLPEVTQAWPTITSACEDEYPSGKGCFQPVSCHLS